MPMIAMTTSSSTSVKARRVWFRWVKWEAGIGLDTTSIGKLGLANASGLCGRQELENELWGLPQELDKRSTAGQASSGNRDADL